jgi:type IV pilus biogenesis protein CpaD/CtpE
MSNKASTLLCFNDVGQKNFGIQFAENLAQKIAPFDPLLEDIRISPKDYEDLLRT